MRALVSVYDKEGIVEFCKRLRDDGVQIISSGGTAKLLREHGLLVEDVSSVTGQEEMMNGRVKTLHPKIHGGILAKRDDASHMNDMTNNYIKPIDIVVVNLYPFEETVKNGSDEEIIEMIDVGGPTLLRAAAKNYKDVIVICDPSDYNIDVNGVGLDKKRELAKKAFQCTAKYDNIISEYFCEEKFPSVLNLSFLKKEDMRYGENPHQEAAFYRDREIKESCVTNAKQLHGKKLSYNNIIDIDDALELVKDFKEPTAAVIKHNNPCGIASSECIGEAYKKAHEADPMSAFGCVVALNRKCDMEVAKIIRKQFVEAVIAPGFEDDALLLLKEKKHIRLMEIGELSRKDGVMLRKVKGGLLVQTDNFPEIGDVGLKVVTKRSPSDKELDDLMFAWKVNKHVKSNAIVFVKDKIAVGIGAGQMSRVDSSIIAARKAGERGKEAVMSSDAFFPFRDGIDEAAKAGITAIIQPGGSIRDQEVIDAADEHGIAMVFSGVRLFKH